VFLGGRKKKKYPLGIELVCYEVLNRLASKVNLITLMWAPGKANPVFVLGAGVTKNNLTNG
jgi:hypothetical protein